MIRERSDRFSLAGTDTSAIALDQNTGVLTFIEIPDYETKSSYSATITASDGVNETHKTSTSQSST